MSNRNNNAKMYKILLVCHSRKGTEDEKHSFENIYKELKIPKHLNDDIFDTNDIFGTDDRDIKLNLSTEKVIDFKTLRKNFNKYNIIYLVNCPCNIYIKGNNLNINFFKNLSKLLKKNGVIITRFSDNAYRDMLKDIKKDIKKSINDKLYDIKNIRHKIRELLINENLNLKLLKTTENHKYINKIPIVNSYDYVYDIRFFFVFKNKKSKTNNKYKFFKSKDNKIIRKKIFIINNKEKVLLGKKKNGEPKYVSFKTFNKLIN